MLTFAPMLLNLLKGFIVFLVITDSVHGLSCHVCQYSLATSSDPARAEELSVLNGGEEDCVNGDTEKYSVECDVGTERCNLVDSLIYVKMTISRGLFGSLTDDFTLHRVERACVNTSHAVYEESGCLDLSKEEDYVTQLNEQMEQTADAYRRAGYDVDYSLEISGKYCECDSDDCNHAEHNLEPIGTAAPGPVIPDDTRSCLVCNAVKLYSPVPSLEGSLRTLNDGDPGCEEANVRSERCDNGQHACYETIAYADLSVTGTDGRVSLPLRYMTTERKCADDSDVRLTNGDCVDLSSHLELDQTILSMIETAAEEQNLDINYGAVRGKMCTCMTDDCNNDLVDSNWQEGVTPTTRPDTTVEDRLRRCNRCFYSKFQSDDSGVDSQYSVALDSGTEDCESGNSETVESCEQHQHSCYTEHVELYGHHKDTGELWSYTVTQRGCSRHNSPLRCVQQETVHGLKRFATETIEYSTEELEIEYEKSFVEGCLCETNGCNTRHYDAITAEAFPRQRSTTPQASEQEGSHALALHSSAYSFCLSILTALTCIRFTKRN